MADLREWQANLDESQRVCRDPMYGKILRPARYDGKTFQGPWAYMCEEHMTRFGVGLGLGLGQELIVAPS